MQRVEDGSLNTEVPEARWEEAQKWERQHWLRQQRNLAKLGKNHVWKLMALLGFVERYRGDDDNQWWSQWFDSYRFLPKTVENMIEVGCGPYTNARIVKKECEPRHLFLSDPLISTYINFKMTMIHEAHKDLSAYLDDHPLESLPFRDSFFDVAIMINVLDHVRDANACMKTLLRILKPGGFVVIGQDLTNEEDIAAQPDGVRTGHPVTLDEGWFEPHLRGYNPIIRRTLSRNEGRTPQWHCATLIFAGAKL
jgi:SAM-dependent methyltransferase